jgi:hypothetical protein
MNPKAEQYKAYLLQEFNKRQGTTQGVTSPVPDMQNPLPDGPAHLNPVGQAYMDTTNAFEGIKNNIKSGISQATKNVFGMFPKLGTQIQAKAESTPTPARPTATPIPTGTPLPTPKVGMPMYFNYDKYRKSGSYVPPQPPPELAKQIVDTFPNEATQAALVASTENGRFDPNAYNYNGNATGRFKGSGDYGVMQINNVTMQDYLRSHPKEMARIGISTPEDLKNPKKALEFSKLISQVQGWGAWYGPKNKGFEIK